MAQSVLRGLCPVGLWRATRNNRECQTTDVLALPTAEVGEHRVARPAARIHEDDPYRKADRSQRREGERFAVQADKAEARRLGADGQADRGWPWRRVELKTPAFLELLEADQESAVLREKLSKESALYREANGKSYPQGHSDRLVR